MTSRIITLGAWAGPIGMTIFGIAISPPIGNFLPIPSPGLPQDQIVSLFLDNSTGVRIAGVLMVLSAALLTGFYATLSSQLRRIERFGPVCAYSQLAASVLANMLFVLAGLMWCVASFRPDRGAGEILLLYDMSWLTLVSPGPLVWIQMLPVALAILSDPNPVPLFPRWVAYVSLWVATLFLPALLVPFFLSGPFAWNGILGFWLPAVPFVIWLFVIFYALLKTRGRTDIATVA